MSQFSNVQTVASVGAKPSGPRLLTAELGSWVAPLSCARHLGRVAPAATLMGDFYGLDALDLTIGEACWSFRWRPLVGPFSGILLSLRLGGAKVRVGVESLTRFGVSPAISHTEVPATLRLAYLCDAGAALWREIEALTERTVELLDVRCDSAVGPVGDCLGFEVHRKAADGYVRGCVLAAPGDDDLQLILRRTSVARMKRRALRDDLPIQWVAVAGFTIFSAAELRVLQVGDVVLIDGAAYSTEALECRLCAGINHRRVGRVRLEQGALHLIEFATREDIAMSTTSDEASQAQARMAGLGEIEVTLRFELARWRSSLAEVSALAEGAVIDIGQRLEEPTVALWVEQRCVGSGLLVAIGDRLGVRVLSVAGEVHSEGKSQNTAQDAPAEAQAAGTDDAEQHRQAE